MQKIFNAILILFVIFIAIFGGFLELINMKIHDKYVEKIIEYGDFEEYIALHTESDEMKYDNYLIWVDKGENESSPLELSDEEDLLEAYTIEIEVNEKFAVLSKAEQYELIKDLSKHLKGEVIGLGFLHKGFYQYLSLKYENPDRESTDWSSDSFYKRLDFKVHQPNNINGITKEEWLDQD